MYTYSYISTYIQKTQKVIQFIYVNNIILYAMYVLGNFKYYK